MDVTKYLALLDQFLQLFLTKDIIGSCALAKILNVMIDSEMSQKQKIDMICSIISIINLTLTCMTCIQVSLVLLPELTVSTI